MTTHVTEDRVLESTTTTGTGNITVAGALTGFRAFGSVCAVGDTFWYALWAVDADGNPTGEYESGLGTYISSNVIGRDAIPLRSSNSNALVNLSAGTKYVAISLLAPTIFTYGQGLAQAMGAYSL